MLAVLVATACGAAGETNDEDEGAIVGGRTGETRHPAVGYLVRNGDASCTGTLIEPDLVVTAAHCVVGIEDIAFGLGEARDKKTVKAVKRATEPRYKEPTPNGGLAFQTYDVSLLALERPITDVEPMRRTAAPRTGRVLAVGYGSTSWEQGLNGFVASGAGTERKSAEGSVIAMNPSEVFVQFDGASTCYGDSGGPIIVDGAIAGVLSRFATQGRCKPEQRTPMGYMRLDATPLFEHARECFRADDVQRCLMEDARGMCRAPRFSTRTMPRALTLSHGDMREGGAIVSLSEGSEAGFSFPAPSVRTHVDLLSGDDARMSILANGREIATNVASADLEPGASYVIVVRSCSGSAQATTLLWRPA